MGGERIGEGKRRRRRMIGGVEVTQINLLNGGDMLIAAKNVNDGNFERIKTKVIFQMSFSFNLYIHFNVLCF